MRSAITGTFGYDTSRPDGMERKLLDVSKLGRLAGPHKTELNSWPQIGLFRFSCATT